jgi:ribosomal subunit interface protein
VRVTITARHCDVTEELRARARALLERLEKVSQRAHGARATFLEEHGVAAVELQLHTTRGRVHVARAEGADHHTALDRATDRLRRQVGRAPARRRTLQRSSR